MADDFTTVDAIVETPRGSRNILHPTDFSTQSGYALHLACALARDYVARLVVLHVVEPSVPYAGGVLLPMSASDEEQVRAELFQLSVPEGVRAERRFERGEPVAEILHVAGEIRADLIVMGTHGCSGLERLLMGSVAERIVRQASCGVLTVKTPLVASSTSLPPAAVLATV